MQEPFQHTLGSDDRAAVSTWLIWIAAFSGAAVLVIAGIALINGTSGMERRSEMIATSQATTGTAPIRNDNAESALPARAASGGTLPSTDFTMSMPLP